MFSKFANCVYIYTHTHTYINTIYKLGLIYFLSKLLLSLRLSLFSLVFSFPIFVSILPQRAATISLFLRILLCHNLLSQQLTVIWQDPISNHRWLPKERPRSKLYNKRKSIFRNTGQYYIGRAGALDIFSIKLITFQIN